MSIAPDLPFPLNIFAVNRSFSQGLSDVLEKSITESIANFKDSVTIFRNTFNIYALTSKRNRLWK